MSTWTKRQAAAAPEGDDIKAVAVGIFQVGLQGRLEIDLGGTRAFSFIAVAEVEQNAPADRHELPGAV